MAAYTRPARTIPYLRRKLDNVIRRAGFDLSSYFGKALINVLETYPRDELFQIDEDTLYQFALAILQLDERPRVRVLPRRDRFDRFVAVLVYIPRDRYSGEIRAAVGDYLAAAFNGHVSTDSASSRTLRYDGGRFFSMDGNTLPPLLTPPQFEMSHLLSAWSLRHIWL